MSDESTEGRTAGGPQPPTGAQYRLALDEAGHEVSAIVTEVAAGIRALSIDGHALTETFAEHETPPSACGIVLFPWPNRVDGGGARGPLRGGGGPPRDSTSPRSRRATPVTASCGTPPTGRSRSNVTRSPSVRPCTRSTDTRSSSTRRCGTSS
jgi:hypothetical protein